MRTPSKAALALAMGVFTASGTAGMAVANAAPRPAAAHAPTHAVTHAKAAVLTLSLPGTGVSVTSDVHDDGDGPATSAGDGDASGVGVSDGGVELGDGNDQAEPVDSQDDSQGPDAQNGQDRVGHHSGKG